MVTNYGNAFNKITGSFTAPFHGLYFLNLYFEGGGKSASNAVLGIHLNNNPICVGQVANGNYDVASCSIFEELKVNDVLNVKVVAPDIAYLYNNQIFHRNSHGFIGFLYKSLE